MSADLRRSRRGQPVVALAMLLACWVGARGMVWAASQADRADSVRAAPQTLIGATAGRGEPPLQAAEGIAGTARSQPQPRLAPVVPAQRGAAWRAAPVAAPVWGEPATSQGTSSGAAQAGAPSVATPATSPVAPVPPRIAAGHQLLWMAALSQLPMPVLQRTDASAQPRPRRVASEQQARWSADAWVLLRRGGNGFNLPGSGLAGANGPVGGYGASQAGAVIRYRLAPASPLRPALYLRATTALHTPRGEEVAGGLTLRPLARLPVAAMIEARATRAPSGTVVRPAAALVSELAPIALPGGLRGEAYLQAGYVGGRGATAFADGQARAERTLIDAGRWQLRAGAGLWGGAQKGAKRLDLGPTATLAVPIGPAGGRLSADWRFRVAGQAAPGSGPAITLSAGF